jgi:hypothetical protein
VKAESLKQKFRKPRKDSENCGSKNSTKSSSKNPSYQAFPKILEKSSQPLKFKEIKKISGNFAASEIFAGFKFDLFIILL